jgi:hypothetical protein
VRGGHSGSRSSSKCRAVLGNGRSRGSGPVQTNRFGSTDRTRNRVVRYHVGLALPPTMATKVRKAAFSFSEGASSSCQQKTSPSFHHTNGDFDPPPPCMYPVPSSRKVKLGGPGPYSLDAYPQVPTNLKSLSGQHSQPTETMNRRTTVTSHRRRLRFGFGGVSVIARRTLRWQRP